MKGWLYRSFRHVNRYLLAHDVRNRVTQQFKAVSRLAAQHRWCLTGTPIQNSIEDLGSLVAFLRIPLLEKSATFQKFIVNQCKPGARNRFKNLQTLLRSICLRRTREHIGLPDPVENTRLITFTSYEEHEYKDLLDRCRAYIDKTESGHGQNGSTAMVQSLLALRLFCNNGNLGRNPIRSAMDTDEMLTLLQQNDQAYCVYCSRTVYIINDLPHTDGGYLISSCSHLICRDCVPRYTAKGKKCPKCVSGSKEADIQQVFRDIKQHQSAIGSTATERPSSQYPSKLLAFLDDIQQQTARKR